MSGDGWRCVTLNKPSGAELTARYETLREHALERHPDGVRQGMALLLRQGVAAWTQDACELATAPAPDTGPTSPVGAPSCSLPGGTLAEVVHVLAAMARQLVEEVPV